MSEPCCELVGEGEKGKPSDQLDKAMIDQTIDQFEEEGKETPKSVKRVEPQCATGESDSSPSCDADVRASADDFDICQRILSSMNHTCRSQLVPEELSLDSILSSLPFRDILCGMVSDNLQTNVTIPVVTRAYEEAFMREPRGGERACASGGLCECMFIDPTATFVGTEFILPNQSIGPTPELCILCLRKVTQKLFYDMLFTKQGVHGVIQRHANLSGVPGEYAEECMLVCPANQPLQCMPYPVMSHQRNRYIVQIVNNLKCLRQVNVGVEDFRNPSMSGQT